METDEQLLLVLVTSPNIEIAKKISLHLIKNKLAACVNHIPGVISLYEWEGKIAEDNEVMLIIKTTARRYQAIEDSVRNLHPYAVPEIIAYPLTIGSMNYLTWVRAQTR